MRVAPLRKKPLTADEMTPAGESPLRPGPKGQLTIVAVTPAVARLARVARTIRDQRKTGVTSETERLGAADAAALPKRGAAGETFGPKPGVRHTQPRSSVQSRREAG